MSAKIINQKVMTLGGCLAMLLVTLLSVVNVKSYHWNILELPHKIDRVVNHTAYNIIGKVLIAALVVFPLLVALVAWIKGRVPKSVAVLPLLVALAFIVILFMARPTSPGIGLWLYAVVAVATFAITFKQ